MRNQRSWCWVYIWRSGNNEWSLISILLPQELASQIKYLRIFSLHNQICCIRPPKGENPLHHRNSPSGKQSTYFQHYIEVFDVYPRFLTFFFTLHQRFWRHIDIFSTFFFDIIWTFLQRNINVFFSLCQLYHLRCTFGPLLLT